MNTNKKFAETLSPVKKRINALLDKGLKPEKVAEKIATENSASIGNTKAFVTMVRKIRLIATLSPVKSAIAKLLDKGLTPDKVAEIVSKANKAPISNTKAYVTMVTNTFENEGIAFKKAKQASVKKIKVEVPKIIETPASVEPIRKTVFGEGKKCMRAQVFSRIKESAAKFRHTKGTILTLSSCGCEMEIYINGAFERFKFLSYEMFASVFENLKTTIKTYNLDFMLPPVNNVIYEAIKKAKKDEYAHLLLDFCESLITHAKDIELALKKDIVQVNGIIWITVTARVKRKGYNTYDELMKIVNESGENRYEVLDIPNGYGSYRDTTPMRSIILRRIK